MNIMLGLGMQVLTLLLGELPPRPSGKVSASRELGLGVASCFPWSSCICDQKNVYSSGYSAGVWCFRFNAETAQPCLGML